jgi:histidyl-tRNA synthetase
MRFDLTVPLSRVVSEYRGEIAFPLKACHIGPVWRAERAQKGRFREFIQADADIVGSRSWAADVEVLQAGVTAVADVGGDGFRLKINHRAWLRAALFAEGVAEESHQSFLIVLDKKDKQDLSELRKELEAISKRPLSLTMQKILMGELSLEEAHGVEAVSGGELQNILESLRALDLPLKAIEFDPSLARGLGYYTGSIFELRHESESFSFGGGGRYDQLIGRFSKESLPAVGFSIGFDRLMLLLSKQSQEGRLYQEKSVFIPLFSDALRPAVLQMAKRLRAAGLRVDVYPEAAKLKNQFKFADARAYRWCLIAGEDEMKSGDLKLKDMKTTVEHSMPEMAVAKSILANSGSPSDR